MVKMMKISNFLIFCLIIAAPWHALAQNGLIPEFPIESTQIDLHRIAQPGTPFNKVGNKFAVLGFESGSFETWAYPVKLFRNFEISFLIGSSTRPISGEDIVRFIDVTPAATTLTYTYQSFTVKATYVTSINKPCAMILLAVNSTEPITIICGFLPVLQPMWPAGFGGQYAYWNDELKYYLISEPTRQNHGFIGSPAASGISYTPAHMLSDVPNEFEIEIKDPSILLGKFIPIYMAGGKGQRDSLKKVYTNLLNDPQKMYLLAKNHYYTLHKNSLRIATPVSHLNLAFEWCKISLDNMFVDNPDVGKGLIAGLGASGTSGRPGFGWFFGGDAFINSYSLISTGAYPMVRDALTFTQKWQRKDGKMAHELSQAAGYIDWFGNYPYGYIHGDTTPFYIVSMYEYFKSTGDINFIRSSWASLQKAYEWCLGTDENEDGLMDNPKAGLGSVEYGALTNLRTDIYLGALSVRMSYCMHELASRLGKTKVAQKALRQYQKISHVFDEKFWDDETSIYSTAFNDSNEHIKEISPWIAFASVVDVGNSAHTVQSIHKLNSADMTTDWGIRSISNKSKYFGALNYNYGAVWPFLSGFVTQAQFKFHMSQQGYVNLMNIAQHVFDNNLGAIAEVYSGVQNMWPQEAVSQQGFSATGFILPLIRGFLGIETDVLQKKITFAPQLPADWEFTSIENVCVENATFSFYYKRESAQEIVIAIENSHGDGYRVNVAPSIGIGAEIIQVVVDGKSSLFSNAIYPQMMSPIVEVPISQARHEVFIRYRPGVEILPPVYASQTGDGNKGLKIISISYKKPIFFVKMEGLAGKTYSLKLKNSNCIDRVEGARMEENELKIDIPAGQEGTFLYHEIAIKTDKNRL